jgi:hypothetical protein
MITVLEKLPCLEDFMEIIDNSLAIVKFAPIPLFRPSLLIATTKYFCAFNGHDLIVLFGSDF